MNLTKVSLEDVLEDILNPQLWISTEMKERDIRRWVKGGARERKLYNAAPVVYIGIRGETVLENLQYRRSRPYKMYREKVLPEVYSHVGWDPEEVKVRWNRYAGCKECPCSPGFVVKQMPEELDDYNQIRMQEPDRIVLYEWTPEEVYKTGVFDILVQISSRKP